MSKTLSFVPKAIAYLLVSVVVGTLLLIAVYSLPMEQIHDHMGSSTECILSEGAYPDEYTWCMSELDNFTDAIMLSEAAYDSNESALQKALLSNRYILYNDWSNLMTYTEGRMIERVDSYARYWHGYLITLKPLLMLTDYSGIRTINLVVQTLLVLLVCFLMCRKGLSKFILPYIVSICIISPLVIAKSLQMSTCYYIFNLGCIAILLIKGADNSQFLYVFLILGIVTAYMDFLTYPLATFGMPAVFYLICTNPGNGKAALLKFINLLVCWGIGYVGMWVSKWILADVITGTNVLANATNEAGIWVDEAKQNYTVWYTLYRNLRSFVLNPAFIVASILAIVMVISIIRKNHVKQVFSSETLAKMLPYLVIAVLPLIWYSVMMAHSYVHDFFTSKALVMTAFSILCCLVELNSSTDTNLINYPSISERSR